jgi:NAD(P)-dependent dehydrogenase (short-subunit alcohol dehydrogenase family)
MSVSEKKKRVLVFGGTGFIGSEICRLLAREGSELAFTYHSQEAKAKELAEQLPAKSIFPCDLRSFGQVKEVLQMGAEQLGGLDALILAAGVSGDSKFYSGKRTDPRLDWASPHEFQEIFTLNTQSHFAACQAASPFLKKNGGGNVVVLGAMDGIKPVPSPVHFATCKSALKGMVESLAKEFGYSNIRINLLAPGILKGGASAQLSTDFLDPYLKHSALKRLGNPQEIAEVATWFALENTYVTGQSILLDGGL